MTNQQCLWRMTTILVLCFFSAVSSANVCVKLPDMETDSFQFEDDILIESADGTNLAVNLFSPKAVRPDAGYPAIIFINSWVLEEHEYFLQASFFAKKGYLVLSYSARGWGCSEGLVDVTGDNDMADLSAVIDWLSANTSVDVQNIGVSGISYGSGISLMGLAKEPRLKTAIAMSTWASLTDSLYQQETPRLFWGFLLVSSGFLTANLDPMIAQNFFDLIFHKNIDRVTEWAEARSTKNFVHLINERNAPVYLANNLGDNLFQPNNLLKFYEQLTVPKRLDFNQGTHAISEGFGLFGLESYTWENAHRWFDYWLKGENTGIMGEPPVTMKVAMSDERTEFSSWPTNKGQEVTFYLGPRGLFSQGKLLSEPYSSWFAKSNHIYSGLDTLATSGIPLISETLESTVQLPVKTPIGLVSRVNGIVFKTEPVSRETRIRGIGKVKLNVKASYGKFQLIAYLYDVAPDGTGTLITHGPITKYSAPKNERLELEWELVAAAYNVAKGHKIALAIDTFDALYAVPTLVPYQLSFEFGGQVESTLKLPTVD
ncbi:CocE/NonD family hydrolase [Aliikangiella sp. G2MR2-5]|uniref:CocE/NonD family hydrolase n=1 Tax=Aliikangiella sp. G2MR2-5 TaxID=2788943 RepID=UPI0018AC54DA|nr:CocE/NonD family hydrolase [Aliikangiella sp. G2MR2-5]